MKGSFTAGAAADFAMDLFKVGTGERPDLICTGIPIVDSTIRGLFPGTLMVVGAEQGVGKSSIVLSAILETPEVAGGIFLEDEVDLVGARALSYYAGVNSRMLRFPEKLANGEVKRLRRAQKLLTQDKTTFFEFCDGSLDQILAAGKRLVQAGCRIIYLDYLQQVRGVSDQRRQEIGLVMSEYRSFCRDNGVVPVMTSQIRRRQPTQKVPFPRFEEPTLSDLKESGDIEASARVALLLWPNSNAVTVHGRLAKCTFGGEGGRFNYARLSCGSLKPAAASGDALEYLE